MNNKFFDYVHAKLPSVINDFEEYRNLCAEFQVGKLVSHQNEAILKAIDLLMTDDAYYAQLQNECLKAQNAWNWQLESEILKVIYPNNGS